jgi:hypothetical protein
VRRRFVENARRIDQDDGAAAIRETFMDRPAEWKDTFDWSWPKSVKKVGECLAVMYRSDKWKRKGSFEDYKHRAEAPQTLYFTSLCNIAGEDGKPLGAAGKSESITSRLPSTVATLAHFMGIQCRFYKKRGSSLYLPNSDDDFFEFHIPHAKLAAGKTLDGETFLVVFKDREGPYCFVFGDDLDVEKDGIVG